VVRKVVGPFGGEFGDEILCWIPHLRHVFGDDFLAISRGGTESWYPGEVINAYDYFSADEWSKLFVQRLTRQTHTKQKELDEFDRLILDRIGLETDFHPGAIYSQDRRWLPRAPFHRFKPVPRYPGLPERYVAVRFYENDWLGKKKLRIPVPDVTGDLPTVGLRLKTLIDNHRESVFTADYMVEYEPLDSFRVLSQVISHAEHFCCNYGSFPFLSLSYGIPTTAYAGGTTNSWHMKLERKLAGGTPFELVRLP
jgi:hypothetical protein